MPGRKAPVLLTTQMVEGMSEGAVVVDMAADQGGNCELTVAGEVVDHNGVHVVGMANPPSGMPTHASFLFARNVANVLGPVSYTHLDVYKRQLVTDERLLFALDDRIGRVSIYIRRPPVRPRPVS